MMNIQEYEKKIVRRIWDLSEPLCQSEGMELVHAEYRRENEGRILRLYIDKPGGIRVDDCASVSRQLSDILDADPEFEHGGQYRLEVSSPGTDRPLGKPSDFDRFKGFMAKIRTAQPVNGQKNFQGVLAGITQGTVILTAEGKTYSIPVEQITRARLVNYNGEKKCS